MTKTIEQDNRMKMLNTQNEKEDKLALLANLLNAGKDAPQKTSENALLATLEQNEVPVSKETPVAAPVVYVSGNNNIVSTQKSTVIVKKKTGGLFLLPACALLFF